jgi:hypothetical protein
MTRMVVGPVAGRRPPEWPGWLTIINLHGGIGSRSLPTAVRIVVPGTVAKLAEPQAPFPSESPLFRGCRMHLPSVWSTRCACSTGAVVFRFILLCLCLPVSRGRIGGTVLASPSQGTCHVACRLARRVVFRPPASAIDWRTLEVRRLTFAVSGGTRTPGLSGMAS